MRDMNKRERTEFRVLLFLFVVVVVCTAAAWSVATGQGEVHSSFSLAAMVLAPVAVLMFAVTWD